MKEETHAHSEPDLTQDELQNFVAHPSVDECVLGDALFYEQTELEAKEQQDNYVEAFRYYKEIAAELENGVNLEDQEANIIVDIFMLHHNLETSKRPENLLREGVKHLHDAFRNRNEFYREDGVDTKINFSVGNIRYVNGQEVWGDSFVTSGIRMDGTGGATASEAFAYCKQLAGTVGDGTRYAILLPHKIQSSQGNVAGFAYLGLSALHNLAGNVTRDIYMGGGWKSKTPIHEVGHSFALFHTFQSSTDCNVESNSINGDRVADTPTETRTIGAPCFLANASNHLSYGAHSGRWKFTEGQKERMWACLFAQYPLALENPRVYWPDETTQPPIPPTPPVDDKAELTSIGYEILDVDKKEVKVTMLLKNATGIDLTVLSKEVEDNIDVTMPINYTDYNEGALLILNAENNWKCPISGIEITGFQEVEDIDGKGILIPVATNDGVTITGLEHSDYTYKIKCKFTEKIGNVQSIISKRIHHNNNESFLYLFTFNNNQIHWDNTTNANPQRRNTGYVPKLNELVQFTLTRDLGAWIKAGSNDVFRIDGGTPNTNLINSAPLRIGFDHITANRGMGGVIYEIELYDRSYSNEDFN